MSDPTPLLQVENLKMHFPVFAGAFRKHVATVHAVDGVDFSVHAGETLGLVGESGCGKSTTGRAILQLYRPTAGSVRLAPREGTSEPVDVATLPERDLKPMRRRMQMIFQDPFASLNPRLTVGDTIAEPIRVHRLRTGPAVMERVRELMELCGLNARFVRRYPHEFSGGQRQRIGIARALAAEPDLIVCDEPISALDVSIQAQILNLMVDLQKRLGLTYIFIAHDLSAVRHISDRIAVMYLGRIVEIAPAKELYRKPSHPYTQALISAVPIPDPAIESTRERIVLTGDLPSPQNPPTGCRFHTRCPYAWDRCRKEVPPLHDLGGGHQAACHLVDDPTGGGQREV
ncbi:MAG: ATP-binding cassette domain-containing protein [Deltaproteobacteria bacterium]|nr:MAG: ATP-binding cassette domain-containing protein [Deltaproteobacteria bacterium]